MVEIGHFALVLAFALALVQSIVPLVGARSGNDRLMAVGGPVAMAGFALVALAFAVLTVSYARSDFSVANVWENSHSLKPMLYKITGTWGNHEGSMLLWVLILTFFGALVAVFGGNLPASAAANVLVGAGLDRRGLPALHPVDVQPLRAPVAGADRGPGPQPGAAGHRPRDPSAAALSRLCRLLDLLFLRGRRADRRTHRRRLGALGAAVDAGRLDRS